MSIRLASREGRGTLAATILGSGVAFLDQSVVGVALPTIGRELGARMAGLQWTVDAYLLTLSALLLVGGSLGDRFGRRRVFVAGLVWFGVASVACGLAPSLGLLVAARAVQGVGAAMLAPASLAMLRGAFHPDDQGRAIALWAGFAGLTGALGPLVGGALVGAVSWRAVFLVNVPVVLLAWWAALRFAPETQDPQAGRLDLAGAGLATAALAGVVYALIEGPRVGFRNPAVAACGLGGVVLGLLFLLVERRRTRPMLPLGLFRSRLFSGTNAATLAVYFGLGGAMFVLVLRLQLDVGYRPLAAGAALLPLDLCLLALSPIAGRVARRTGFRAPMTVGPLVAGLGLVLLARVGPGAGYVRDVLPGLLVLGLGLGTTVAPLTSAALAGVEARHAGVASAVNNAVARVAGLLAVAVLPGVGGFPRAMRVAGVVCALGGAIAGAALREGRRPPMTRRVIRPGGAVLPGS